MRGTRLSIEVALPLLYDPDAIRAQDMDHGDDPRYLHVAKAVLAHEHARNEMNLTAADDDDKLSYETKKMIVEVSRYIASTIA